MPNQIMDQYQFCISCDTRVGLSLQSAILLYITINGAFLNVLNMSLQAPTSAITIQQNLMNAFSSEDMGNTGLLPLRKIMQVLKREVYHGLGLTAYHIGTILSSVQNPDTDEVSSINFIN